MGLGGTFEFATSHFGQIILTWIRAFVATMFVAGCDQSKGGQPFETYSFWDQG